MRLSTDKADVEAYRNWHNRKPLSVYLDGVRVTGVHFADDEAGEVHRYSKDASGNYIIENDCLRSEVLKGKVEFRDE
jgi:hypothetical protein